MPLPNASPIHDAGVVPPASEHQPQPIAMSDHWRYAKSPLHDKSEPRMETGHDPLRHLRYLRQSLSQDNESVGFFISAGCPLSVSMPTEQYPLIPDVLNLTKFINKQLTENEKYQLLLGELEKAQRNSENVEEILSFIRALLAVSKGGEVRGLSEEDLLKLEKAICSEIVHKINVQLPAEETPYHRFCNWIRSIDRKLAVEIFTTNYDLLVEQALEDYEVPPISMALWGHADPSLICVPWRTT